MREILFRGFSKEDNQWRYGYVYNSIECLNGEISEHYFIIQKEDKEHYMSFREPYEVYVDSIGQYTGFEDKNGNKIFEGDILRDYFGLGQIVTFGTDGWEAYVELSKCNMDCKVTGNIFEEKLKMGNSETNKGGKEEPIEEFAENHMPLIAIIVIFCIGFLCWRFV